MNALGFVLCILTVLAFGAALSFEKQTSGHRLRSAYLGHLAANRDVLDQAASGFYASFPRTPSEQSAEEHEEKGKEPQGGSPTAPPLINPDCARLNLTPLIERGKREEPYLYETMVKLLRVFYNEPLFDKKPRAEYKFLDAFLKESHSQAFSGLEKIALHNPEYQAIYYRMLKGMKRSNLLKGIGYPSLLDYVKLDPAPSKVCLYHAHPNLLSVFFTPKGAAKLYAAMHAPKAPALTQETIERICREVHAPLLDPGLYDLLEIQQRRHAENPKTTVIGEDPDSETLLRKVVALHPPT